MRKLKLEIGNDLMPRFKLAGKDGKGFTLRDMPSTFISDLLDGEFKLREQIFEERHPSQRFMK